MKDTRTGYAQVWLIAGLVIFSFVFNGHSAGASVSFTNQVATFTDSQGHDYVDATIVRADFNADGTGELIYRTNGDYNAISFAKLSPSTLRNLGVPSNYADIARDRDTLKQEALARESQAVVAEQQRLLDATNLVSIRVDAVISKVGYDPVYGNLYSCRTQFGQNPALLSVLVAHLPDRISAYYDSVAQHDQAIAALRDQIAGRQSWVANASTQLSQQQSQIEQERAQVNAGTAGMADWVYPAAVQRNAVRMDEEEQRRDVSTFTNAQHEIVTEQNRLKDLEKDQLTLKDSGPAVTTLLMLPSRRTLNGFKIFVCAPESMQPQVNVSATASPPAAN